MFQFKILFLMALILIPSLLLMFFTYIIDFFSKIFSVCSFSVKQFFLFLNPILYNFVIILSCLFFLNFLNSPIKTIK